MPPAARKRTPAMQQFDRFKASHPDCVLFFRMGDFYEMFDDDAVLCHQVLGITLTERSPGTPMAGVPHHALEPYLRKLVEQGFRVAVCDQIQDPKEAKGVVDRAVTRVLTPGTLVDETLLDDGVTNVVAAVLIQAAGGTHSSAEPTGIFAACEISTGTFETCRLPLSRLLDEVMRIGPREVLFAGDSRAKEPDDASDELKSLREELSQRLAPVETFRPAWTFRAPDAAEILTRHFGVAAVQGWGYEDDDPQIQAAGALLHYLIETQAPRAGEGGGATEGSSTATSADTRPLAHLMPPKSRDLGGHLIVDATSLASLEIERTIRGGQTTGALLSVLPTPRTPMGKRLIRDWLCFPLATIDAIVARQDMVQTLVDNVGFRERLQDELRAIQDVARINARIAMRRATPRDLCALGQSLAPARNIAECLAEHDAFAGNAAALDTANTSLAPLAERLQRECVDTPPAHMRTGGLIRDGVDPELDEARSLQRDSAVWLADYQAELAETSGIPSLKTGYNKVFGYYIEITHAHRDKVPAAFHRKQTLKNAERYITPELKDYEEKVLTAESRAFAREQYLFDELCRLAAAAGDACRAYADLIAEIDVLIAFARCESDRGWTRPTMTPDRVIQIRDGRHPVLDRTLDGGFVPNDCSLDASGGRLALITGPNMAGKSTFIRQVALLTLLAHAGAWVPAASATIGLTDRIFTRIGASDELHAGRSTFMVEMTETANILHHATDRSLVILDEIGRGTSTLDGLSPWRGRLRGNAGSQIAAPVRSSRRTITN